MKTQLLERFLRYVAISSQSDASATTVPSTPGQLTLARLLADELTTLGLCDVHVDAHGILTFRYTEPMTWWMALKGEGPRTLARGADEARRLASAGLVF